MPEEMTVHKVAQELRTMASELVVDNGDYGDRLRAAADWMEGSFARMLHPLHFMDAPVKPDLAALKAHMEKTPLMLREQIVIAPPQMPDSEVVKRQSEIIEGLQKDIALLRRQLHEEWNR